MLCHKSGFNRMFTQYGPSWIIPIGVKNLDLPHLQKNVDMRQLAKSVINPETGAVSKSKITEMVPEQYAFWRKDVALILAQLTFVLQSNEKTR